MKPRRLFRRKEIAEMLGTSKQAIHGHQMRGAIKPRKERDEYDVLYGWNETKDFVFEVLVSRLPKLKPKMLAKPKKEEKKDVVAKVQKPQTELKPAAPKLAVPKPSKKPGKKLTPKEARKYMKMSEEEFNEFEKKHFTQSEGCPRRWPVVVLDAHLSKVQKKTA